MQTEYNVSILTESYVESILEPLKGKEIKYTELHTDVVTMYLQCLSIASELLQPEQSAAFFEATNIHYLIGMAIKFGDKGMEPGTFIAISIVDSCIFFSSFHFPQNNSS